MLFWLALQGCMGVTMPDDARAESPPTEAPAAEAPQLKPFTELAEATAARDIPRFQAAWHPEGWGANLVGGSGLSGAGVAKQVKSEGWKLVPDPATLAPHADGGAWVVRCAVVLPDGRTVDAVHAVVVAHGDGFAILGAGESADEAFALADRAATGKPLAP